MRKNFLQKMEACSRQINLEKEGKKMKKKKKGRKILILDVHSECQLSWV